MGRGAGFNSWERAWKATFIMRCISVKSQNYVQSTNNKSDLQTSTVICPVNLAFFYIALSPWH